MIEIKREDNMFISNDGKVFTTKEECLKYEGKGKFLNMIAIILLGALFIGYGYLNFSTSGKELSEKTTENIIKNLK